MSPRFGLWWMVSDFECFSHMMLTLDSAIFQAGSLLVLIAESRTRAFLASIVPMIVNTVLNEHQLVLDIVAFVQKGDFPRSRLGEKQRGKILASWVSRKMRTIAQFSIRDPDAEGSVGTAVPNEVVNDRRGSVQSGIAGAGVFRGGPGSINRVPGTAGSSLRHVESISQLPLAEEPHSYDMMPSRPQQLYTDELPRPSAEFLHNNDHTPTNERPHDLTLNTALDYSPVEGNMIYGFSDEQDFAGVAPEQYEPPPRSDFRGSYGGRPHSPEDMPMQSGGLRVANRTSIDSDDDWSQDALRHLNLNAR
jgi:hypothetical protein